MPKQIKKPEIKYIFIFVLFILVGFVHFSEYVPLAEANNTEDTRNIRAEVVDILEEGHRFIPGTNIEAFHQTLEVEILEGAMRGEILVIDSDFHKFDRGDRLFLDVYEDFEGEYHYVVSEPDRLFPLLLIFALFVAAILSFGFWKGVRSILSLGISFAIIIFILLPRLLDGASPVPTIIVFASLILALAMYITHGFNRVTHSAFFGTAVTLLFVGLLSYLSVSMIKLSGFSSHEALYLNLQTGGLLDISGLLLGAIIIGILGILDDVSITQSATVRELYRADPGFGKKEVFRRALSVGKEHIVSLVNTLALAYAGASLPLLLLFSQSQEGFLTLINMEIFATEITRTLVGSIGLIMAVPVTTLFAAIMLKPKNDTPTKEHVGE